ncbi:metalloendopeptidase [Erythrobacter sp. KY5]|uniref:murein hydrolase activator EnvC family protein n=1 Tax=Erythrobacter sp. KY5 TaxID=2011159 RepID=UPI000DBEFB32|nr:peptidoglycan DD-metalloendopeptidase family protein [Erythrobacter sp. KY5]AWW73162.1 metalloendopeptidase [Erythrobacter sp. KY5]
MSRARSFLVVSAGAICAALLASAPQGWAQRDPVLLEPDEAQAQLERATREGQQADARAERFAREAEAATEAAEKTAREAASLAAQIQAAEAGIAIARARYSLAQSDRARLSARLAQRQQPLVRLTGALQTSSRRPLALSALQPGSLKDLVYVRAVLASAVPEIRQRTTALRGELEQGRRLEERAARAIDSLRMSEQELQKRRTELAALETRQRIASREARGNAAREGERALALAEEARDLDGLIDRLDDAAQLRRELAALPGPILRPRDISRALEGPASAEPSPMAEDANARLGSFQLPVQGRTLAGFGELRESGLRSTGLTLAPAAGALAVAPASGRVAFAGPYRGFGRIVIIEHPGGWTSLVTGLASVVAEVGDEVIGGAPLGNAGNGGEPLTIELRREGEPVNPLNYLG